jgi:hypothetical protein
MKGMYSTGYKSMMTEVVKLVIHRQRQKLVFEMHWLKINAPDTQV